MNVLIFECNSHMIEDVTNALRNINVSYKLVQLAEYETEQDYFERKYSSYIDCNAFDLVFSIDYFSAIATGCHKEHIPYISWVCNNTESLNEMDNTISYKENHIFLYDRILVEKYRNREIANIQYMPLAVGVLRLGNANITPEDIETYSADISLVGRLYNSTIRPYNAIFDEYTKGYLEGIINAQKQVYGCYFVEELLQDGILNSINACVKQYDVDIDVSRSGISRAIAKEITREEQLVLLKLLGSHYKVNLYSDRCDDFIQNSVRYMGDVNNIKDISKIFKLSKININVSLKNIQSGISAEAINTIGAGGFLISNYQAELDEYFGNGNGVVLYESINDAYEKIEYYMKHDKEREIIARNGFEIARREFTYEKQLEKIIGMVM